MRKQAYPIPKQNNDKPIISFSNEKKQIENDLPVHRRHADGGGQAGAQTTTTDGETSDMTSHIVNPNFDDGLTGWTNTTGAQGKISTSEKKNGTFTIKGGQNHMQLWSASAIKGQAYQTISQLPEGYYEVSADIINTGFNGTLSLFANGNQTAITSNSGKRYSVSCYVIDGTLTFGLDCSTAGSLIDFDTFTLLYKGKDITSLRETLASRLANAKTTLANASKGVDTTPLQQAISNAESLPDSATASEVQAAIKAIDKAMDDYKTALSQKQDQTTLLALFEKAVAEAKAERQADSYPDTEAFDKAISEADLFLANLKKDLSIPSDSARNALYQARENYYNSQFTVAPSPINVSEVDLTLNGSEKYVLRVDGKPYYGTEIQVRPDKLRGTRGWTEEEIEAAFKRAADDNFNTLSVPVFWSEVEPEKNHFDWRILDRYMGWCHKYGMKMELLWFSWSSGGRVQRLWDYNGRQQLRTPDYVCSADGKSDYNMLRTEWEYSLDWRDANLRDRETYVLSRIMDHVALWDANNGGSHTVIGVQLGNEARAHGGNTATAAEIIDYYHHVGAAVKGSKYVTWTRLNCVSHETGGRTTANENKRNNGGTNIDFVGIDLYGTNASSVIGNINGQLGATGKNYRMIMEIDAKDSNSPVYQMAALAGNKAFDYYNLGPIDGNGLYDSLNHKLVDRAHITLVRQRNKILNLANQDIALYKHGKNLFVYNYAGNSTNKETGYKDIVFAPDGTKTQAIAVKHTDNQIALLSTQRGVFTLPASLNATSAEKGYFDQDNNWVKEGDVPLTGNRIVMPTTSCVLVRLNGDQTPDGISSATTDNAHKIIAYYGVDGRQVSKDAKGLVIAKYDDGMTDKFLR